MCNPPLSARLLGSLDLSDDAVFDWLEAFTVNVAIWAILSHQAEVARSPVALSYRYQAPMLWRDVPDGEYGVIARYNHGGRHYAIPRMTRPPDIARVAARKRGEGARSDRHGKYRVTSAPPSMLVR